MSFLLSASHVSSQVQGDALIHSYEHEADSKRRSFPRLWVVLVPYLIWIQFDRAPVSGGRPKKWARNFFLWKYFARERLRIGSTSIF